MHLGRAFAQTMTALVLGLSVTLLTCGLILLGWSYLGERTDLWDYAVPMVFLGQAGLLLGIVLHGELARRRRGLKFNTTRTIEGLGDFRLDSAHELPSGFGSPTVPFDPRKRWSSRPFEPSTDRDE